MLHGLADLVEELPPMDFRKYCFEIQRNQEARKLRDFQILCWHNNYFLIAKLKKLSHKISSEYKYLYSVK